MVHAPKFFQNMILDIEVINHSPFLLVLIDFSLEMTLEPKESISEKGWKSKKIQHSMENKIHLKLFALIFDFQLS